MKIFNAPHLNLSRLLYILLGICLLLLGISLIYRYIHIDDAWLGEQAFWWAKKGHVKSELFRGLIGYEERQYFYHKLFIWLGGTLIALFGFDLYLLKGLSLVSLFVFLAIFVRFQKKAFPFHTNIALLTLIVILVHPLVFHYSFVYRPEIILMTVGFASFALLFNAAQEHNNVHAFWAGVLGGMACLIHLNGLSIALAGFFAIAFQKEVKLTTYYVLGGIIVSFFFFMDLSSMEDISLMLYQFQHDPALIKDDFSAFQRIVRIFQEHQRFFWDLTSGAFSVFFLIILLIGYKGLKGYKFLTSYTLFAILILAGLAHSKTTKYMLIYLPYLWLILMICINYIYKERRNLIKYAVYVGVIYLGISFYININLLLRSNNIIKKHADITETYQLRGQKIIAPMEFIFDEIKHSEIQAVRAYRFFKERNIYFPEVPFNFYQIANYFDRTFILLKRENFEELGLNMPSIGEVNEGFQLVDIIDNNYFIYKKINQDEQ